MVVEKDTIVGSTGYYARISLPYGCYALIYGSTPEEAIQNAIDYIEQYGLDTGGLEVDPALNN